MTGVTGAFVAAYIVAEHILPPATMYVDGHGTYCRRTSCIVDFRHILLPIVNYCQPATIYIATVVCVCKGG